MYWPLTLERYTDEDTLKKMIDQMHIKESDDQESVFLNMAYNSYFDILPSPFISTPLTNLFTYAYVHFLPPEHADNASTTSFFYNVPFLS